MRLPGLTGRHCTAGSVAVPEWFLPVAAVGALTLPIVILFTFGDMDTDRFRRQQNGGVTLQGRAVNDFKRGLTKENFDRVLLRLGVKKAEPPPTAARDAAAAAGEAAATARSELGCDPHPRPAPASSISHFCKCSVAG